MKDNKVRKLVAHHIKDDKVFDSAPTAEILRNWRRAAPSLTPQDQKIIEEARKSAGTDCKKLVSYFVGFMHLARMPAPLMRIERS
jgi:hypothetical protein